MIPKLKVNEDYSKNYRDFAKALRHSAFSGEVCTDYASRLAVATDNSIYQIIPQIVIFPKSTQDVSCVFKLAQKPEFDKIIFAARGAGSSTCGQSLVHGCILDFTRHMHDVLEINTDEQWVRVQPGVVLDQVNKQLKPLGYKVAIGASSASRCSVGGNINTDACGIGSCLEGRTSNQVAELTRVLVGGTVIETKETDLDSLDSLESDVYKSLCSNVLNCIEENLEEVKTKFPHMARDITGYNMARTINKENNSFNLNYLLCGSEGTLAVITECVFKLTPLPKHRSVFAIKYSTFKQALQGKGLRNDLKPFAIETVDEEIVSMSAKDPICLELAGTLFVSGTPQKMAINLVEFIAESEDALNEQVSELQQRLQQQESQHEILGFYQTQQASEINLLYELRKKGVELVSRRHQNKRQPIPFIEDTMVDPDKLADYMQELCEILDKHHLIYGIFGHIDAGCLHVRPALDMQQTADQALLRKVTGDVAELVQKYNGVLWGEHGKGYRSQYAERYFGPKQYKQLRTIKSYFDENNRLNPGKVATSIKSSMPVVSVMGPFRGNHDKGIRQKWQKEFEQAIACNGNAACLNVSANDVMCPSYKVTYDHKHSPKGRATLLRAWTYMMSHDERHFARISGKTIFDFFIRLKNSFTKKNDFSQQVYEAMEGCLGCKACVTQCPLNVNVPLYKGKFLNYYYQRYLRHPRDFFVANIERIAILQSKFSWAATSIVNNVITKSFLKWRFGLIDLPEIKEPSAENILPLAQYETGAPRTNGIVLWQDVFTSIYQPNIAKAFYHLLTKLGYTVYFSKLKPTGMPLHENGYLTAFNKRAKKNMDYLNELATQGMPILSLEPTVTLSFTQEYKNVDNSEGVNVRFFATWLSENLSKFEFVQVNDNDREEYFFLPHCSETALAGQTFAQWQTIFKAFGLKLTIIKTGCCGMAGIYGHVKKNLAKSKELFETNWGPHCERIPAGRLLATGFSCRGQVKRFGGHEPRHPIEVLSEKIGGQE